MGNGRFPAETAIFFARAEVPIGVIPESQCLKLWAMDQSAQEVVLQQIFNDVELSELPTIPDEQE